jgi:UDP-N-acetyl-D-glucosamine dehydrogenase
MKAVIIGQGYVGLPLSKGALEGGVQVTGLESKHSVVDSLMAGRSHVDDISDDAVRGMLDSGYTATADERCIAHADVVVICVPTPLSEAGGPDLTAVEAAATKIAQNMTSGTLVILESTTYPGTTDSVLRPILESSGLTFDEDFFVAFSPERIDPGNTEYGLKNTPKVIGGSSKEAAVRAVDFYGRFVDETVLTGGTKEAETAKLLENTYRHVNIALMNEMAKFCHELKIDIWEVIAAAKTKPFGFQAFYPGPGVGGHCIPIDPNYLSFEVQRTLGYPFRFVELAQEVNASMPKYVADRAQDLLNDAGKPFSKSRILLLGITYKANIADSRESPSQPLGEILVSKGVELSFHDPLVREWSVNGVDQVRVPDLALAVQESDLVILLQNHGTYDIPFLEANAPLLLDTRGVTSSSKSHRL